MRGQGAHNHRASGDDAYAAKPECISVLAPLLGLDRGTSAQDTKAAVLELLRQANERALSAEAKDAAERIALATAPEPGRFDLLEVRPVSFKGDILTLSEVAKAVTLLRDALYLHMTSGQEKASLPAARCEAPYDVSLPEQPLRIQGVVSIGDVIPAVLTRTVHKRVTEFEKALRYLQDNGIVAPSARETISPSPEVTQKLAKHYMVWKWNSNTQSWDPRLNTGRNQSLFTAAPRYLETIALKGNGGRDAFIRSLRNARSVEDNPRNRAEQSPTTKLLSHDLIACATYILDRDVSLPTVLRLQALYRFLNPTPPQSTDSQ